MTRRRRIALVVLVASAVALLLAPAALAAAGGGSAGFGGGGSGGGGGGGRGAGLYILIQILIRIAIIGHGLGLLILVGLVLLYFMFVRMSPRAQQWHQGREESGRAARRLVAARQRRVELAAAEAAEDDPAFAPDNVHARARKLFTEIQSAWDAGDRERLRALVAPELLDEWNHRLDDFENKGWRNRVQLIGEPVIEYVGLSHRGGPEDDRVVVRIESKLRDYVEDRAGNRVMRVGRLSDTVSAREYWTLGKRGGQWILRSIEQGSEGEHALGAEIIASPWADDRTMRDQALVEGAIADAVPDGTKIAEVADLNFTGDARAAALDLSLADGRFAPDVLEVAARRAVAAWAEAVDGEDDQLRSIASPEAVEQLLHPGDPGHRTRLVVRGPRVRQIRIAGLDAGAEPPTMTLDVDLEGRRYVEDRGTTAVLSGSRARVASFTEHWELALDGDAAQPWRIAAVGTRPVRA